MSDSRLYSILETYLDDSTDTIEGMKDSILKLDSNPGDRGTLNALFRLVHSFKGASRFMGFSGTAEFAHRVENILDGIRNREYAYSRELSGLLYKSVKELGRILEHILKNRDDRKFDFSAIMEELEQFQESTGSFPDAPEKQKERNVKKQKDRECRRVSFNLECGTFDWNSTLMAEEKQDLYDRGGDGRIWNLSFGAAVEDGMEIPRVMLGIRAIEEGSTFFKSVPPVEYLEEEYDGKVELLIVSDMEEKKLRDLLGEQLEIFRIKEFSMDEITAGEKLDEADEDEAHRREAEPEEKSDKEESRMPAEGEDEVAEEDASKEPGEDDVKEPAITRYSTIKVDIRKMDDLMNLLGELVINRTRSEDLVQELELSMEDSRMVDNLRDSLNEQSQIINDIQDKVMSSRLVAVKSIFQEVTFVVRDMARRLEKEVDCRISGESTELDKRLVDSIRNPIMHIVKNAVDHGIESPQERESAGKPVCGVISVDAHREHNQIIITISDDGRGIDLQNVAQLAAERGFIDSAGIKSLSDEEALSLLTLPGFSTRDKVTGDSGRGVGMDVVKSILEEFNGKLEIHTEKGKGTEIILRLPITLAIIRGLMVGEGDSLYILPISVVSEVIRIRYGDIEMRANGDLMLKHRNSIMRLHEFGNIVAGDDISRHEEQYCFVIVIRYRSAWRGLIVSNLIGEREVVIKEVRKTFIKHPGISGVSIMGDGSVVPVIDIGELMRSEKIGYRKTGKIAD